MREIVLREKKYKRMIKVFDDFMGFYYQLKYIVLFSVIYKDYFFWEKFFVFKFGVIFVELYC